ncbi:hypothetical protein PHMEG_00022790 [Phytophthora megakarya]|uniref:Caprin-1 dimerization domain-containing protein n=1 Tax=Phytophthora megakarya TaxID=4795 RepID=A0A225VJI5_9STRA|nr:hypothetical protein PHMEG_00022790 [Phytophthora megakarya]
MASEPSNVNKSDAVAVVGAASEAVSLSVSTTSQKKTKTKVKAAIAAVAATQELSETEHLSNLSVDHPYLSVLYKRIRSHRKKLEKIKGLEQAKASEGKVLNAQQLELMSNKATLEKLVGELELLREQFVGVYAQELEQKQQEADNKMEEEARASLVAAEEKQELEKAAEQESQEVEEKTEEVKEDFTHVYELMKTLHVVNLHQAMGKEVPMVLDFFSKVLLGNTRPPAELSYEENLIESLEEAKKYLMDSDKVFACDTTYSGLRAFVDQLANISSGKKEKEEVVEVDELEMVEETSDVPVVPAEINTMPQISFFTESQLESEKSDEITAAVEHEATESHVEIKEVVSVEEDETVEVLENNEVRIEEQVEKSAEGPPAPESVPAPPLSFAVVASGVTSERTPSPSASSGSSGNDKKEGGTSPRKNPRRRGQGRWREKGSNSNSGSKSGTGSPTDGGKPRRPRGPRTNDENSSAQGGKRNRSKEDRLPRVERGLRKQGNPTQQHSTPMIAPHA